MIPRPPARWQTELAAALNRPEDLLARLGLDPTPTPAAASAFPLRVPLAYLERMQPGDGTDPLLRQVLPRAEEDREVPGFARDPVNDLGASIAPGLLRKYPGRALLVVTGACPIHCRYCFRRHFPYPGHAGRSAWEAALAQVAADDSIREVILSGGDPLTVSDERLAALVRRIAAIPHVRRLRLHTRTPIVLPSRVDGSLLAWLKDCALPTVIVLHANHPAELDGAAAAAARRLAGAGATLLNQSVLLRGVNDDAEVLAALSERLFEAGILPYYLHQLDRVQGAAHFQVDDTRARALLADLRGRLPGYLVPRLVREVAGGPSKLPL
ncbi:MAG: EF-P beta-lysylation protein EpmB [Gammaproteobacteria bacterium]|jgi:EF-P beta-lysylation protein EpmB|nr:EF-P beta-lysylation protein EpmB [Gammaproteobacteria bacterium]